MTHEQGTWRSSGWSIGRDSPSVIVFGAYLLAAQLGFWVSAPPALLSPAAGVALAGLVVGGRRLWPAILASGVLAYAVNGASLPLVFLLPVAYTLQAVVGATMLERLGFNRRLERMRDIVAVMLVASTTAMIIPTVGYGGAYLDVLFFGGGFPSLSWGDWWVGVLTSLLIVAPFAICWLSLPRTWRALRGISVTEGVAAFVFLIAVALLVFLTTVNDLAGVSLVYVLLIPLFWLALRVGPAGTTLGLLVTSVIGFTGVFVGPNAAAPEILGDRLFQSLVFFDTLAVIFLVVVSLSEERRLALHELAGQITKLEDALTRLQAEDQAKRDFLSVLGHELRNPLAPLVTSIELLRLRHAAGEDAKVLELMEAQVRTIRRLLDDLLDVGRISRGKLRLQTELVDLRSCVRSSLEAVRQQFDERGQAIAVSCPDDPFVVEGDVVRLQQVVSNLLSNASKYTPSGGRVTLAVSQPDDLVELRVSDTGMGIDPDVLDRIFEPFFQVDHGHGGGPGLGVGLWLTKRLVEAHGGSIRGHSDGPDRGSTFTVRLPLATGTPAARPVSPSDRTAEGSGQTSRKILVVDDNESAARSLASLMEMKGALRTACAFSAASALDQYDTFQPDAVVLDIGLPDADGYEVARTLRTGRGFRGPLVAVTGYGLREHVRRAFEAGFDHCFSKPVAIDDVLAATADPRVATSPPPGVTTGPAGHEVAAAAVADLTTETGVTAASEPD